MRLNRDKTTLTKKRWAAYAAAGAAGAVAVLGPQASVDAEITVVEVNANLEDQNQGDGYFDIFGPYTFGASGASFVFQQAFNETGTDVGQLTVVGAGNMTFVGFAAGAYFYPSNLAYGVALDGLSDGAFGVGAGDRGDMAWGAGYTSSQFLEPGTGYLGFRFDLGGGTQFGWAEVDLNGAPDNRGTFVRYAYGMVGDTVFVGEQGGMVIPEPGSLGMLALGSIGLMTWRRKRAAA